MEHCVKLGVYARRVANKTSRSAERGRRRQNLRYPVKSHSQKRQTIADFCRFLLALLTSRRKNRHSEVFYLLTLPPQGSALPTAPHRDKSAKKRVSCKNLIYYSFLKVFEKSFLVVCRFCGLILVCIGGFCGALR